MILRKDGLVDHDEMEMMKRVDILPGYTVTSVSGATLHRREDSHGISIELTMHNRGHYTREYTDTKLPVIVKSKERRALAASPTTCRDSRGVSGPRDAIYIFRTRSLKPRYKPSPAPIASLLHH